MSTREQTRVANLKHVFENVIFHKHALECLKSIKMTHVRSLLNATPKDFRAATYEEDGTTEPIPSELFNDLIAFGAYVRWRNNSTEITERIDENYFKVTEQDLIYTVNCTIFRTSDGNYSYNAQLGKMEEVAPRALATTAPNPSSTLAHSRSPVSEWNRGVRRDKNAFTKLHKLEDLEQWTRDNKKTAKAQDLDDVLTPITRRLLPRMPIFSQTQARGRARKTRSSRQWHKM
jgi:hypothetical protein